MRSVRRRRRGGNSRQQAAGALLHRGAQGTLSIFCQNKSGMRRILVPYLSAIFPCLKTKFVHDITISLWQPAKLVATKRQTFQKNECWICLQHVWKTVFSWNLSQIPQSQPLKKQRMRMFACLGQVNSLYKNQWMSVFVLPTHRFGAARITLWAPQEYDHFNRENCYFMGTLLQPAHLFWQKNRQGGMSP